MKTNSILGRNRRVWFWVAATVGVLGIIGGTRMQVWGNDIAYRDVIRKTDYLSAGIGGLRNVGSGTITLRGMTGTVHSAWLYWAGPSNSTNAMSNASITFGGSPITGEPIGSTSDNCWGFRNSHAYRADVTGIVAAKRNNAYIIANTVKQGTNINANGASLLVFYDDGIPSNDRDIVLYDGNDSNAPNLYDMLGWNVLLNNIRYTNGQASIHLHVSDGQSYKDGAVVVNGAVVIPAGSIFQGTTLPSANNGPINNGDLWDIKKPDVTTQIKQSPNTLRMTHKWINPGGDCVSLIVAAINLPAGAAPPPGPELTNHAPSIVAENEVLIHTPHPVILEARATDIDGDALTVSISMDGEMKYSGAIERGLSREGRMLELTNAFRPGTHTLTFTANDGSLSAEAVMAVRVVDNTPPVVTVPANITKPTDPGKATAVVTFTATATDDFDSSVTVVCAPVSGNPFPVGVTTVTCTATDSSTNIGTGTFTVTVTDGLPPVITCPADLTRPAMRGTNVAVVTFTVVFTDNERGATLACVPPSGSTFPLGSTAVNCTARDVAGNTASCSFNVIIVDNEPPVLDMPPTLIASNDVGQCAATVTYNVRADDNMPGTVIACVPASGSIFPVGTNIVRCVATDAAGNTASNSFRIVVRDVENPTLTLSVDILVPCVSGKAGANVTYTANAIDNCSAARITCTPASGSFFPDGTNIVRCTARDDSGNTATGSFKVIVVDTEPPVIKSITPSQRYLWPPNHKMISVALTVVATDNCGPVTSRIVSVTSNQADGGLDPADLANDWKLTAPLTVSLRSERYPQTAPRLYTIRVEAKDMAGNVTYGTTVVNVNKSSSQ
jgi:hypothetical protein